MEKKKVQYNDGDPQGTTVSKKMTPKIFLEIFFKLRYLKLNFCASDPP